MLSLRCLGGDELGQKQSGDQKQCTEPVKLFIHLIFFSEQYAPYARPNCYLQSWHLYQTFTLHAWFQQGCLFIKKRLLLLINTFTRKKQKVEALFISHFYFLLERFDEVIEDLLLSEKAIQEVGKGGIG